MSAPCSLDEDSQLRGGRGSGRQLRRVRYRKELASPCLQLMAVVSLFSADLFASILLEGMSPDKQFEHFVSAATASSYALLPPFKVFPAAQGASRQRPPLSSWRQRPFLVASPFDSKVLARSDDTRARIILRMRDSYSAHVAFR